MHNNYIKKHIEQRTNFAEKYKEKIDNKYCLDLDLVDKNKEKDLSTEIMFLMNLISNEEILVHALQNTGLDTKLMPIEKINMRRINGAYEVLYKLNNHDANNKEYEDLIEEYYKYIPYVINKKITAKNLNSYFDSLDIIRNIYNTYSSIIKHKNKPAYEKPNIVHGALGMEITLLEKNDKYFDEHNILKYLLKNNNYNIKYICKINNEKQSNIYKENTKDIKDCFFMEVQ